MWQKTLIYASSPTVTESAFLAGSIQPTSFQEKLYRNPLGPHNYQTISVADKTTSQSFPDLSSS